MCEQAWDDFYPATVLMQTQKQIGNNCYNMLTMTYLYMGKTLGEMRQLK